MGNYLNDWLTSIDSEGSEDYGEGVSVESDDQEGGFDDHDIDYES